MLYTVSPQAFLKTLLFLSANNKSAQALDWVSLSCLPFRSLITCICPTHPIDFSLLLSTLLWRESLPLGHSHAYSYLLALSPWLPTSWNAFRLLLQILSLFQVSIQSAPPLEPSPHDSGVCAHFPNPERLDSHSSLRAANGWASETHMGKLVKNTESWFVIFR